MKIEKTVCDICGKENAKTFKIPVYRTFDATDGRSFFPPSLDVCSIDLCECCALKATNIHSVGVMCHKYELTQNPTINYNEKK